MRSEIKTIFNFSRFMMNIDLNLLPVAKRPPRLHNQLFIDKGYFIPDYFYQFNFSRHSYLELDFLENDFPIWPKRRLELIVNTILTIKMLKI